MTDLTGTLRHLTGRTYAGSAACGPAAYTLEGISHGRDRIAVTFRNRWGRTVGAGDFGRDGDAWACPVTLEGFAWSLTGRITEPGVMAVEGAPAQADLVADGVLPF